MGGKAVAEDRWMCSTLVNDTIGSSDIFPFGYKRDLRHVNLVGSYFLVDAVEEGMFGEITRRETSETV